MTISNNENNNNNYNYENKYDIAMKELENKNKEELIRVAKSLSIYANSPSKTEIIKNIKSYINTYKQYKKNKFDQDKPYIFNKKFSELSITDIALTEKLFWKIYRCKTLWIQITSNLSGNGKNNYENGRIQGITSFRYKDIIHVSWMLEYGYIELLLSKVKNNENLSFNYHKQQEEQQGCQNLHFTLSNLFEIMKFKDNQEEQGIQFFTTIFEQYKFNGKRFDKYPSTLNLAISCKNHYATKVLLKKQIFFTIIPLLNAIKSNSLKLINQIVNEIKSKSIIKLPLQIDQIESIFKESKQVKIKILKYLIESNVITNEQFKSLKLSGSYHFISTTSSLGNIKYIDLERGECTYFNDDGNNVNIKFIKQSLENGYSNYLSKNCKTSIEKLEINHGISLINNSDSNSILFSKCSNFTIQSKIQFFKEIYNNQPNQEWCNLLFNLLIDYNDIELLDQLQIQVPLMFTSINITTRNIPPFIKSIKMLEYLLIENNNNSKFKQLFQNLETRNGNNIFGFKNINLFKTFIQLFPNSNIQLYNIKIAYCISFFNINEFNFIEILKYLIENSILFNTNFSLNEEIFANYKFNFKNLTNDKKQELYSNILYIIENSNRIRYSPRMFDQYPLIKTKFMIWQFKNRKQDLGSKRNYQFTKTEFYYQIGKFDQLFKNEYREWLDKLGELRLIIGIIAKNNDIKSIEILINYCIEPFIKESIELPKDLSNGLLALFKSSAINGRLEIFQFLFYNYPKLLQINELYFGGIGHQDLNSILKDYKDINIIQFFKNVGLLIND